ncbi:hypothetical protein LR48_Vigan02g059600 [Vigna angularis]|uniref:Uncharacterized protein n=1 Tax=Phaseolus angularis TaxID=3914 RepID=A0A0L9TVF6_PHAAN|nr:hypothetical protein LR48_Vigan02g059600 [Vigna angularis]
MHPAQALGRAVHVDEVFAQTHVRKGTNQFVDERSRKTHEEFSTRLSQVRSEHESAPTPDDASNAEDDIPSRGGTLKHQPSSSTTTPDEDEFNIPPTQPQPSSSPTVPQQPTSVQPSSVQPSSVQPTAVQPSIQE